MFDRFWRADPARARTTGGTGLGLAIALEDARLHGGWLEAWGEPGRGSVFRLTLPRVVGRSWSARRCRSAPTRPTWTRLVRRRRSPAAERAPAWPQPGPAIGADRARTDPAGAGPGRDGEAARAWLGGRVARGWPRWPPPRRCCAAVLPAVPSSRRPGPTAARPARATRSYVQPIPPVPQPGWSPRDIVQGFLAGQRQLRQRPRGGSAVPRPPPRAGWRPAGHRPRHGGRESRERDRRARDRSRTGRRQVAVAAQAAGDDQQHRPVRLPARPAALPLHGWSRPAAQWRITACRTGVRCCSPRPTSSTSTSRGTCTSGPRPYLKLVPEPVFAPQQDTYAAAATSLVNALLRTNQDRGDTSTTGPGWPAPRTTGFPRGDDPARDRWPSRGQTATVNLGGAAAKASSAQLTTWPRRSSPR